MDLKKEYQFTLDFEVRDYECDMQGIVNNSVYLNYFEHARHKFLKNIGENFSEFVDKKINLVISRLEIDYKKSLKSGDNFSVGLLCNRITPLRFEFLQDIFIEKIYVSARTIVTAMDDKGKIIKDLKIFDDLFSKMKE
jgi:acyl-CoA thioester hydrolase